MWGYLRRRPFGLRFNRQYIIGRWVADFYCAEWKIVIEADGATHRCAEQKQKDFDREQAMAAMGITTMRFSNEEILLEIEWIDKEIGLQVQRLREMERDFNNTHKFIHREKRCLNHNRSSR